MREIKFRAWDKDMGKYHYPLEKNCEEPLMSYWIDSEGEGYVVEQFTGLQDKNGKEIYEGDIVHYQYDYHDPDNWVVVYKYDQWSMQRGNRETGDMNVMDDPHHNVWEESVVIGNIHENPELLGEKT